MIKKQFLVSGFFVAAFFLVGFVPYLKGVDKKAAQFLYLILLNIISSLYLFFNWNHIERTVKSLFNQKVFWLLCLFPIWSILSFFIAENKVEVLIDSSRIVIYTLSFSTIFLHASLIKNKIISHLPVLLTLILSIEIIMILNLFIERFTLGEYYRDMGLRAFTGNINITAFILLVQLPWVIYFLNKSKLFFSYIVYPLFFFILFLLGSRGANLMSIVIILLYFLFQRINKNDFRLGSLLSIVISFATGLFFNKILFSGNRSLEFVERTTTFSTNSTFQRLRFWKDAFNTFLENPLFGIGTGNWKIKSIDYDRMFMKDYSVPYHVHNDFLEILAEQGIIGFFLFFSCLGIVFLILTKKLIETNENKLIYFTLFISILVYTSDSLLNFPFARPISQIHFLAFLAITLILKKNEFEFTNNIFNQNKRNFFALLIVISIPVTYISYKVLNSFQDQNFLILASRGRIENIKSDDILKIKSDLPNLTATAVPIEAMKANILLSKTEDFENLDTILKMVDKGNKANPYMYLSDAVRAVVYAKKQEIDSSYIYAKKAFYGIPDHNFHFNILMDIIEIKKDSIELNTAYSYMKKPIREGFQKRFLEVSKNIKSVFGDSEREIVNNQILNNSSDQYFYVFSDLLDMGEENLQKANLSNLEAEDYFKKGDFSNAALKFEESILYNPNDNSFYENAANSYMKINNNKKAIEILNKLFNRGLKTNGNAEFLMGLLYTDEKKYDKGCEFFIKALEKEFSLRKDLVDLACKRRNISEINN